MKNKKKKNIIYSTNQDFKYEYEDIETDTPIPKNQNLEIYIDKHRAGKITVIIKGFKGRTDDLKLLGRMLKTKCGVGGTVKNNEIIIQGDIRNKIMNILEIEGYNYKRVGG
mgnify:CR=1 FL=1